MAQASSAAQAGPKRLGSFKLEIDEDFLDSSEDIEGATGEKAHGQSAAPDTVGKSALEAVIVHKQCSLTSGVISVRHGGSCLISGALSPYPAKLRLLLWSSYRCLNLMSLLLLQADSAIPSTP